MNNRDVIDMAQRCIEEIDRLRAQVDRLAPKAEAYDLLRDVVNGMQKGNSIGYGEDLVWRLKKQIEELRVEPSEGQRVADGEGPEA
jgi:hypothetical protein